MQIAPITFKQGVALTGCNNTGPPWSVTFCELAFHNGWKDRNVDCCVNTAVDPSTSGKISWTLFQ